MLLYHFSTPIISLYGTKSKYKEQKNEKEVPMEKYFSCKEVAEKYGVKVKTVWGWISSGKLKAVRIGKLYRIKQQDLDAFEASNN